MSAAAIKNIIFDLGGVIIDIDKALVTDAFRRVAVAGFDKEWTALESDGFFRDFETGKIESDDFLRKLSEVAKVDEAIVQNCWKQELQQLHGYKLDHLRNIKSHYRLFLLSNTNVLHLSIILKRLSDEHKMKGFDGIFEKEYYSFEMGLRKPGAAIFQRVLNENQLAPSETLFIDDDERNRASACGCGIQVLQVERNASWELLSTIIQ